MHCFCLALLACFWLQGIHRCNVVPHHQAVATTMDDCILGPAISLRLLGPGTLLTHDRL